MLLVLAAGCTSGPAHGDGLVTGLVAPCVGLAAPGTTSVTAYARRDGHVIQMETVLLTRSPGNPYRLRLPAGQYVISAPRSDLPSRTVSVRANQSLRLNFLPACK
jgi:hypothetical protein